MARFYELKIVYNSGQGTSNWLVTAPAFPEVTTFADDKREACVQGLHAIEEAIAGRIADGMDVPAPMKTTPGKGYFVEVPALTILKVALYMICSRRGVSRAELARQAELAPRAGRPPVSARPRVAARPDGGRFRGPWAESGAPPAQW